MKTKLLIIAIVFVGTILSCKKQDVNPMTKANTSNTNPNPPDSNFVWNGVYCCAYFISERYEGYTRIYDTMAHEFMKFDYWFNTYATKVDTVINGRQCQSTIALRINEPNQCK